MPSWLGLWLFLGGSYSFSFVVKLVSEFAAESAERVIEETFALGF